MPLPRSTAMTCSAPPLPSPPPCGCDNAGGVFCLACLPAFSLPAPPEPLPRPRHGAASTLRAATPPRSAPHVSLPPFRKGRAASAGTAGWAPGTRWEADQGLLADAFAAFWAGWDYGPVGVGTSGERRPSAVAEEVAVGGC